MEILQDMVKSTLDDAKAAPILKKVTSVKNLSRTMSALIKNIVSEIDSTREQMFKILESYAAVEILTEDHKKFSKK
jgi:uncharacterized coiled-coil DUF342 family protein